MIYEMLVIRSHCRVSSGERGACATRAWEFSEPRSSARRRQAPGNADPQLCAMLHPLSCSPQTSPPLRMRLRGNELRAQGELLLLLSSSSRAEPEASHSCEEEAVEAPQPTRCADRAWARLRHAAAAGRAGGSGEAGEQRRRKGGRGIDLRELTALQRSYRESHGALLRAIVGSMQDAGETRRGWDVEAGVALDGGRFAEADLSRD